MKKKILLFIFIIILIIGLFIIFNKKDNDKYSYKVEIEGTNLEGIYYLKNYDKPLLAYQVFIKLGFNPIIENDLFILGVTEMEEQYQNVYYNIWVNEETHSIMHQCKPGDTIKISYFGKEEKR